MTNEFIVNLDKEEKAELIALIQRCPGARKIKRANILQLPNIPVQRRRYAIR